MKKIYSANVTPLTENGEVDRESLARLLERNLAQGIDGFFFLGSMEEWAVG
jgi:dihydrodipicolinate synthase/N-acetylneuraminate lyase